jgi:PadR family transcriptional regulator PadR
MLIPFPILVRRGYGAYICGGPTYGDAMLNPELKKGTTPLLILALLEAEPRHGYELSKRIESQSGGVVRIHAASLYPLLYRLEKKRWIQGRWVEKAGQRRRRFYHLTEEGKRQLEAQRNGWTEFVRAVSNIAGVEYA